jgi:DNA-binding response OmpR family regulator
MGIEKCKILVVDDELMYDSFFTEFFAMNGYEVFAAYNGQKAIEIAQSQHPKVVLLDIRMPEVNGFQVLEQIKKIDSRIMVIMVTALLDNDSQKRAQELGADGYVTKPFDIEALEKTVRTMCAAGHS